MKQSLSEVHSVLNLNHIANLLASNPTCGANKSRTSSRCPQGKTHIFQGDITTDKRGQLGMAQSNSVKKRNHQPNIIYIISIM